MNYVELPELPNKKIIHTVMPEGYWYGNVYGYTEKQMQQYALLACGDLQRQLAALTEDYKDLEAQLLAVGAGGVSKLMGNEE